VLFVRWLDLVVAEHGTERGYFGGSMRRVFCHCRGDEADGVKVTRLAVKGGLSRCSVRT
jgi:hypothetical protein